MNKEMKRSFRIFILKILAVVFVLCICYFLYAFVYRAKTELPTKAVVTNRGAAVYTLQHLGLSPQLLWAAQFLHGKQMHIKNNICTAQKQLPGSSE